MIQIIEKQKIFFNYYYFLLKCSLKKKTSFFIGLLFIIFLIVFLVIVPNILKTDPFFLWTNVVINPQMFMLYSGSLLAAIFSIAIFKDFNDNGTELLIMSRPISRFKIVLAKFFALNTITICFCIICSSIIGFMLINSSATGEMISALFFSLFISNYAFIIIFALLATFVSMYLSKVWTMLVNVTFSILFVIYSITVNFSVYDATREALSDKNHFIRTSYHLNGDGTISRSAIVRNFLTLTDFNVLNYNFNFENEKPYDISVSDQLKDYYILSNEKERSYWEECNKKSIINITNFFNFSQQYSHMNNSFTLQNKLIDLNASSFGQDSFLKYKINNNKVKNNNEMFFVTMPKFSTNNFIAPPSGLPEDVKNFWYAIQYTFSTIANQNSIFLGTYNVKIDPSTTMIDSLTMMSHDNDNFNIAVATGKKNVNNKILKDRFKLSDLKWNDDEKEIFTQMLRNIWNANQNGELIFSNIGYNSALVVDNNVWKNVDILDTGTTNQNICNIWDYTKNSLCNRKDILNIKSDYDLMLEVLKFKYFIFHECICNTSQLFLNNSSLQTLHDFQNDYVTSENPLYVSINNEKAYGWPILPAGENYQELSNLFLQDNKIDWTKFLTNSDQLNVITNNTANNELIRDSNNPNHASIYNAAIALLNYAITKEQYGYFDIDPDSFGRDFSNAAYLITDSINTFFDHEKLSFEYEVTPIMNFWEISLCWMSFSFCLGILIFIIYYRRDFK